jgi:biopolymer transport protein ExbB/TolQ
MCMAAIAERLSESIMPAALGLAVAIVASWGYKYLSARMSEFDIEMRDAVRDLPDYLAGFGFRL